MLLLLVPLSTIFYRWCKTPPTSSGGGIGAASASARSDTISGSGGGTTPSQLRYQLARSLQDRAATSPPYR